MRYILNTDLKRLIEINRKKLGQSTLKTRYKNWLYYNQSIDILDLQNLCEFLNVDLTNLKLDAFKFNYEKNFGKYDRSQKYVIKFIGLGKEFAEFIGIMLGDGHLSKREINITIDKREVSYSNYISELFLKLFNCPIKKYIAKNKNWLKFYSYNREIINLLVTHGLIPGNKVKNNVGIPEWIKNNTTYIKPCIRGLMDTDGCVFYHKRDKQIYLNFSNKSQQLLSDFLNCSKMLGFNFVSAGKKKGNLHLHRKADVTKYINEIGFSNEKHINRYKQFTNVGP